MTPLLGLALLGSYLAGSIPFGLLVVRAVAGKDVREIGSGNIGATNDLGWAYAGPACGAIAVVGHCFPVWLGFRGGKGVATGLGVALALAPWAALAGAATWLALYKVLRVSSIGSLAGVAVALVVAAFTAPRASLVGFAAVAAVIVVRHKSNLERLLQKSER